jgi:hypothetical protein
METLLRRTIGRNTVGSRWPLQRCSMRLVGQGWHSATERTMGRSGPPAPDGDAGTAPPRADAGTTRSAPSREKSKATLTWPGHPVPLSGDGWQQQWSSNRNESSRVLNEKNCQLLENCNESTSVTLRLVHRECSPDVAIRNSALLA